MGFKLGQKREPSWREVTAGIRVEIKPYDAADYAKARQMAINDVGYPKEARDPEWGFEFNARLAVVLIRDWRGVVEDDGKPAALTPENIMEVYRYCDGFNFDFDRIVRDLHEQVEEKNDYTTAPNGNGAAVENTASDALSAKSHAPEVSASTGNDAPSSSTNH